VVILPDFSAGKNSPLRYVLWRKVKAETRKLAAILAADVVGYSRLAGTNEDRTLSRLRGLRSDLFDPAIAAHRGRVVRCLAVFENFSWTDQDRNYGERSSGRIQ